VAISLLVISQRGHPAPVTPSPTPLTPAKDSIILQALTTPINPPLECAGRPALPNVLLTKALVFQAQQARNALEKVSILYFHFLILHFSFLKKNFISRAVDKCFKTLAKLASS
jgi:hypothetical protein